MKVSEFFLGQTTKEIRSRFKEVNLDNYKNIPETTIGFCTMFGLEDDGICDIRVAKSTNFKGEIYVKTTFPNPQFPDCPIKFDSKFYANSQKNACSLSLGYALSMDERCNVFKKMVKTFDNREDGEYIEYNVFMKQLSSVNGEYIDYGGESHYVLRSEKTLYDLYTAVCERVNEVAPLIRMFIDSTKNDTWEQIWNKTFPQNKWYTGKEIMNVYHFPIMMMNWHRAVNAGIEPKIEEFIKYFIATIKCQIGNTVDKNPLYNWDSDNISAARQFRYILNEFDKKYNADSDIAKWCKTYREANELLISIVKDAIVQVSNEYNINSKYLECIRINEAMLDWNGYNKPDDAYMNG